MLKAFFALMMLFVAGCSAAVDPSPIAVHPSISLYLFAAPWCEACQNELAEVNGWAPKKGLTTKVWIGTGANQSSKPNDVDTKKFQQLIAPNLDFQIDPWKFTMYHQYYGASASVYIPGAVILDENGAVLKLFSPGTAANIVQDYVNQYLGN